jgi:hypothetical protein
MIASPENLFALCVRRMFCGGWLNARRKARLIRSRSAKPVSRAKAPIGWRACHINSLAASSRRFLLETSHTL